MIFLRDNIDNPTIGILLCKSKNNVLTEYALKDINKSNIKRKL
jgi:hypothetical protein